MLLFGALGNNQKKGPKTQQPSGEEKEVDKMEQHYSWCMLPFCFWSPAVR